MNFFKKLFGSQRVKEDPHVKESAQAKETLPVRESPHAKANLEVEFKREVRKQHPAVPSIHTRTKTYAARSREAAIAFLQKQKITGNFVYIEVVTPSGIFGTDKTGDIYDSGGELPDDSATLLLHDQNTTEKPSLSQTDPAQWKTLSESLHTAAEDGGASAVAAMLTDNPDLALSRVEFFGETSLHAAARKGRKDIVALLLQHGADVNVRDQNRQMPLHDAASEGHVDVVALLLANGADANATMHNDLTALHNAARGGHVDVIKLLLEHGADVNAKDRNGYTPLNGAEAKGHDGAAELLRQRGGRAKPKPPMTIKRSSGPLIFATNEEIVAAQKAGKISMDDTIWVEGHPLLSVKHIVELAETRSSENPSP